MPTSIATAYIELRADTSRLQRDISSIGASVQSRSKNVSAPWVKEFSVISGAAIFAARRVSNAMLTIAAPLTAGLGKSLQVFMKQGTASAMEYKKEWDATNRILQSSVSRIGELVSKSQIFGRTISEWKTYAAAFLGRFSQQDIQKFVNLAATLMTVAVSLKAVAGALGAIRGVTRLVDKTGMFANAAGNSTSGFWNAAGSAAGIAGVNATRFNGGALAGEAAILTATSGAIRNAKMAALANALESISIGKSGGVNSVTFLKGFRSSFGDPIKASEVVAQRAVAIESAVAKASSITGKAMSSVGNYMAGISASIGVAMASFATGAANLLKFLAVLSSFIAGAIAGVGYIVALRGLTHRMTGDKIEAGWATQNGKMEVPDDNETFGWMYGLKSVLSHPRVALSDFYEAIRGGGYGNPTRSMGEAGTRWGKDIYGNMSSNSKDWLASQQDIWKSIQSVSGASAASKARRDAIDKQVEMIDQSIANAVELSLTKGELDALVARRQSILKGSQFTPNQVMQDNLDFLKSQGLDEASKSDEFKRLEAHFLGSGRRISWMSRTPGEGTMDTYSGFAGMTPYAATSMTKKAMQRDKDFAAAEDRALKKSEEDTNFGKQVKRMWRDISEVSEKAARRISEMKEDKLDDMTTNLGMGGSVVSPSQVWSTAQSYEHGWQEKLVENFKENLKIQKDIKRIKEEEARDIKALKDAVTMPIE